MVLQDWLVRLEREDGLPRIVVRRLASGEEHVISFAEEAYSLGIDGGYEFATDVLRFTYSSMTTPEESGIMIWRRANVLCASGSKSHRPQQRRLHHATAVRAGRRRRNGSDFTALPQGCRPRRDAPCLLYGYGAYGISMPAAFSSNRLSLVDRGFVYAIAHVRGGSEKGWRWYREGKLAKKTTPLPISSPRASISARTAGARRERSWPKAGPRAGP
jgi:oligopeptidase B